MRAVTVHGFGPVESHRVEDRPDPLPGPGQVLVDLHASDVNFPDILLMEGKYQKKPALPFVPGMGGAGRVVEGGEGLAPGQKVLVLPDHGTFAERVAVAASHCLPVPEEMPFDTAAALGLVYQTAWFALERGGFRPGDRVLVLGASGGVGMAAVQLARALGAGRVIAATRGGAALDADAVVDSAMPDLRDALPAAVRAETGGQGADIVIDPVGGALSAAALRCLGWQGRQVIVGFAAGEIPAVNAGYLLVKHISVLGLQWTDYRDRQPDRVRAAQERISALWAEGRLRPVIRSMPLDRHAEALADLKAGRARGKTVLTMRPE